MTEITAREKIRLARQIERQGQMRLPGTVSVPHDSRWQRVEPCHQATWTCSACGGRFNAGWRCVAGEGTGTAYCLSCWGHAEEEPEPTVNLSAIS